MSEAIPWVYGCFQHQHPNGVREICVVVICRYFSAYIMNMPQSLTKVYLHLVFSTKNRERVLSDEDRVDLHAYFGGSLKGCDCQPIEINSEPDHVHLLFLMGRRMGISDVVAALKRGGTDWLRQRSTRYAGFHWQSGYGIFSVSESSADQVRSYIQHQREHHRVRTFEEEYRALLDKHKVEYDERYVWE
jgi:putative transposase